MGGKILAPHPWLRKPRLQLRQQQQKQTPAAILQPAHQVNLVAGTRVLTPGTLILGFAPTTIKIQQRSPKTVAHTYMHS